MKTEARTSQLFPDRSQALTLKRKELQTKILKIKVVIFETSINQQILLKMEEY